MADPGWVGAYGVQGGYEALARLIAERKKDELLAAQEQDRQRALELREWEAQQRAEEFRTTNQRLKEYSDRLEADRQRTNLEQRAEKIKTAAQIGQVLQPRDVAALQETGYGPLVQTTPITRAPGLIETMGGTPAPAVGPETGGEFRYGGTGAQRDIQQTIDAINADETFTPAQKIILTGEVRAGRGVPGGVGALFKKPERTDEEEIAYQARLEAAKAAARAPYKEGPQGPSPYFQMAPSTGSPFGAVVFDARTGKFKQAGPEDFVGGAPAPGVIGSPATKIIGEAASMHRFISSLDALEEIGDKYNWQGVGVTGPLKGWMAEKGLISDPIGTRVRAAVSDVRSFIGHERYGAALTQGERATLDGFIASASTPGAVTKEMIQAVREVEKNVMARTLAGPLSGVQQPSPTPQAAPSAGGRVVKDPLGILGGP